MKAEWDGKAGIRAMDLRVTMALEHFYHGIGLSHPIKIYMSVDHKKKHVWSYVQLCCDYGAKNKLA